MRFSVVTEPFSRRIRPLCVRTYVKARRSDFDFRSVLNKLSFLNISRGGRVSTRQVNGGEVPSGLEA
jgi:hypothetical protein